MIILFCRLFHQKLSIKNYQKVSKIFDFSHNNFAADSVRPRIIFYPRPLAVPNHMLSDHKVQNLEILFFILFTYKKSSRITGYSCPKGDKYLRYGGSIGWHLHLKFGDSLNTSNLELG